MKIYRNFSQTSGEWMKARLGIPTASEFHHIVTPLGKLSEGANKFAYRLAYEILMRQPAQDLEGIEHMERGKELEPHAVKAFEFANNIKTEEVGFITNEGDGENFVMGCSPDRLLPDNDMLEVKCPTAHVHMQYMIEGPPIKYRPQRQGQLMVGHGSNSHFLSWHPFFPHVHKVETRDEAFISLMRRSIKEFCAIRDEIVAKIKAQGFDYKPDEILDVAEKELRPYMGDANMPEELIL